MELDFRRAYVVGILNVTPDSFSDGGRYAGHDAAVARGREMATAGAMIIDIGGESTRPNAEVVSSDDELRRVLPVIETLAADGLIVSVDTTKSAVAGPAIAAGALLVNDISGGLFDPDIIDVTAASSAGYVLGHVRGADLEAVHAAEHQPPSAADVERELGERLARVPAKLREKTICDPGLGFGKPTALNLELTQNSGSLSRALQCPVMIGPSRKRFLGDITGKPTGERDAASVGAALAAVACGAHFVRVHAVAACADALLAFEACGGGGQR